MTIKMKASQNAAEGMPRKETFKFFAFCASRMGAYDSDMIELFGMFGITAVTVKTLYSEYENSEYAI
jgi:hypothetical protein